LATQAVVERWDTAVDLLTRVLDQYPHHPQTAERLAEAQRQQRLAGWDAASRQAAEQGRWVNAVLTVIMTALATAGWQAVRAIADR
jgi:hypothetical protein